jgi:hypothetical protein
MNQRDKPHISLYNLDEQYPYADSTFGEYQYALTVENVVYRFKDKQEVLDFLKSTYELLNNINKKLKQS